MHSAKSVHKLSRCQVVTQTLPLETQQLGCHSWGSYQPLFQHISGPLFVRRYSHFQTPSFQDIMQVPRLSVTLLAAPFCHRCRSTFPRSLPGQVMALVLASTQEQSWRHTVVPSHQCQAHCERGCELKQCEIEVK